MDEGRHSAAAGPNPSRFYLIDILRGLASFAVVIWHYQHFFANDLGVVSPRVYIDHGPPFLAQLRPFYNNGYLAVDLFFVISGFIFYRVYSVSVGLGSVGSTQFIVARLARLYPLHLVTLLLVLVGQMFAYRSLGHEFIYTVNDSYHFVLNIFFASSWGFQSGLSFNGPVWSVSIEILLYAVFFGVARAVGDRRDWDLPAIGMMLMTAFVVSRVGHKSETVRAISTALVDFFLGGLAYQLWLASTAGQRARWLLASAGVLVTTGATLAFAYGVIGRQTFPLLAYPACIVSLAVLQSWRPEAGRSLRLIGDITYSVYLIHFPVQLAMVLAIHQWSLSVDFEHAAVLLVFVALLIVLAIPVHYGFELPAQRWVKRRLMPVPHSHPP